MKKWPLVALKDLGEVTTGSTPSSNNPTYFGGVIPFVTPADLDSDTIIVDTPRTLSDEGATKARLLPVETVLVSCIGNLGKMGFAGRPLATNQQINAVTFDPKKVFPRYGFYACSLLKNQLETMAPATTLPIVSKSKFEKLQIPLPPLEEQKRIAAILDQADALRRLRQRSIDRLNSLGQAIFYEMFGDPVAPNAPISVRLGDIAELINGDRSSNYPSGDDIKDKGILFLNTTNIKNGELDFSKSQFITEQKFASLSRGKLSRGDLVITLRGTLGQCGLFDCEFDTGFINAQMMIIRCREGILPRYLKEYISFPSVQTKLGLSNSGSAVPQLTATQMREMQIIVPTKEEQQKFVDAVIAMHNVLKSTIVSASTFDRLFESLQHKAFNGELSGNIEAEDQALREEVSA